MGLLVIRHRVKNYSKWRPQFDQHVKAQRSAGLTDPRVFRSSDDPNEVVILFTTKLWLTYDRCGRARPKGVVELEPEGNVQGKANRSP
jgi:hypothetical protein